MMRRRGGAPQEVRARVRERILADSLRAGPTFRRETAMQRRAAWGAGSRRAPMSVDPASLKPPRLRRVSFQLGQTR